MTRKLPGFALLFFGGVLGMACVTTERVYVQPAPQPAQEPAPVQETVSYPGVEDEPFYDDLRPYGEWVYVSGPGWVWSPYRVPAGWRPYAYGRWVYTDYGLTWASDESFGWAVYHYGRWYADPGYGWVWVPGTQWGPAWVAWHEGGGYVGWAPLPWQVSWRAGVGLDWGGVSINVALGPSAWYFVHDRDLVATNLHGCVLPAARNVTLIRNTVHVTNYVYVDNRIVDRSVRKEKIGRAVGHTIPSYRVRPSNSPDEGRGGRVKDQEFVVFRRDPGRVPQRREVPPGHDGSPARGDRDDRFEDRGARRREIPPGHDAYPPQDDVDRSGGSQERQRGRDSMQPRDGAAHDAPPAQDDARRNPPAGRDPNRDRGTERRPQRYGTPATEGSEGQPARGPQGGGNGKQGNPPDNRTAPDQRSQGQQGAPQGNGKPGNAGQGSNAGSVSKPPSAPPGQAKPGNAAPKPAQGNKPAGKGKGKKPAPPDPKPETEKPEEAPKDDSGSGN